jgi:predicted metal-binding protein
MTRVAIIGCKRIQDSLCIACAKCLKAAAKKEGKFAQYEDDIELVALGDCGDCPGLIMPKLGLMKMVVKSLDSDFDVIHLGTCIVKAAETANCPMDLELVQKMVKSSFGKEVVLGTHDY